MKRRKKNTKSYADKMREAAAKYGVTVTDMSDRGVRAIGFIGGVRRNDGGPRTPELNTNPTTTLGE